MSDFTPYTAVAAEGARIGLFSCLDCGATVMLDNREEISMLNLHGEWHAHLTANLQLPDLSDPEGASDG